MNNPGRLKEPYPMTEVELAEGTKERILLEATVMFAKRGYASVSMRDIAEKVGIKVSSLYNHFDSKDKLWESVLENVKTLYITYFERLAEATSKAEDFRSLLRCMFLELHETVNIFTYYGFSLVIGEQLTDDRTYEIYNKVFLEYSIGFIEKCFDDAIAAGMCRPFDTKTTAISFMHNVLMGIMMRANRDMGRKLAFDVDEMFVNLEHQIYYVATGEKAD